jgi:hypothetical protein
MIQNVRNNVRVFYLKLIIELLLYLEEDLDKRIIGILIGLLKG